jgi:hypothetical protein
VRPKYAGERLPRLGILRLGILWSILQVFPLPATNVMMPRCLAKPACQQVYQTHAHTDTNTHSIFIVLFIIVFQICDCPYRSLFVT